MVMSTYHVQASHQVLVIGMCGEEIEYLLC
jgi:hypothetical protein